MIMGYRTLEVKLYLYGIIPCLPPGHRRNGLATFTSSSCIWM